MCEIKCQNVSQIKCQNMCNIIADIIDCYDICQINVGKNIYMSVGGGGSLEVKYFQSPRVAVFLDRRETSVSVLFPPMRTGCPLIGARCPSFERWLISNLAAQLLRRRMDIGIATAGFYCKL